MVILIVKPLITYTPMGYYNSMTEKALLSLAVFQPIVEKEFESFGEAS